MKTAVRIIAPQHVRTIGQSSGSLFLQLHGGSPFTTVESCGTNNRPTEALSVNQLFGMSPLEQLASLKKQQWMPWTCSWYPSKPATAESVAHIEEKLKLRIPRDFVELSRLASNYGVWFGSIGDDYQSHNHLLRLNEAFHDADLQAEDSSIALPAHWVLINHGHDGACDCFDITSPEKDGEYPIYHMNVEYPKEPKLLARSFRQYLNDYA